MAAPVYLLSSVIAPGADIWSVCPGCGSDRCKTPAYALTAEGPVFIGAAISCDSCDVAVWQCGFCSAELALDGEVAYQHISVIHARREEP